MFDNMLSEILVSIVLGFILAMEIIELFKILVEV